MEAIIRRPTKTTPYVHLDVNSGTFVIAGRSIPIEAELFYRPLLNWLDELLKSDMRLDVQFCFRFEFFNIASSKRILFLLYKLAELQSHGFRVVIRWMYEKYDEDMLEIGQDYNLMLDELRFVYEEYDVSQVNQTKVPTYS
jgi:hypothetical protein